MPNFKIYLIFLFGSSSVMLAQSSKVLVQNDQANTPSETTILVKWYASGVLFPEGVNVYRREEGTTSWNKLNTAPIFRKYTIADQEIARDSSLALFSELVNEGGWETFEDGDFLELNAIIKSFSSNVFADFLGIFYVDYTAVPGKTYTYRVQKYQNGRELLLGQSNSILAGDFSPGKGVSGFSMEQNEKNVELDWEIEEELYFGVNIYRSTNNGDFEKLNKNPLVISQIERDGALVYPSPKFIDEELEENEAYTYQLRGVDFFNQETLPTENLSLNLADVTPPMPPKYLERELDTMIVRLKWTAPEGDDVKEVILFRGPSSDGPFEPIFSTLIETEYTDFLEVPGPYFYYVSSFDESGNEAQSRTIFADIKDLEPPMPPTGVKVVTDTGKYTIQWNENTEADLYHYRVFRKANSEVNEGVFLLLPEFPTEGIYEYRLPKNTLNTMSFYVVAVDTAANVSPPSITVSAQIPDVVPPQTPQIRDIEIDNDNLTLSWYRNVEPDLEGYNLLRADSIQPIAYQPINQSLLSPVTFQYTDRSIEYSKGYLYKVIAFDENGNSSESAPKYAIYDAVDEITVEGDINLGLQYRKRRKIITLRWTSVEMEGALGYIVFKGSSATSLRPITALMSTLQFRDTEIADEKAFYQIKAYNKAGSMVTSKVLEWEK